MNGCITLQLQEAAVRMVQTDRPKRQVYVKFIDFDIMQMTIQNMAGMAEFKHETDEISQVQIEIAGMGTRRVRIASLPPEIPDAAIQAALSKFGEVRAITEDQWSHAYRYPVSNGVRIAMVALRQHVPSVMNSPHYIQWPTHDVLWLW
jgi:hypothetical protein